MGQIKNMKFRVDFILIISHKASSGLSHLDNENISINTPLSQASVATAPLGERKKHFFYLSATFISSIPKPSVVQ